MIKLDKTAMMDEIQNKTTDMVPTLESFIMNHQLSAQINRIWLVFISLGITDIMVVNPRWNIDFCLLSLTNGKQFC